MKHIQIEQVAITRDDKVIRGDLYLPPDTASTADKLPIVIISHAFGGSYRDNRIYAEALAKFGYAAYVYDFCGGAVSSTSGGSTTEMSLLTELQDLRSVIAHFSGDERIDITRLFLMGESQGGYVSALAAAEMGDSVQGLILIYPALCIQDDIHRQYGSLDKVPEKTSIWGTPLGKRYFIDAWNIDPIKTISAYKGPVLMFHGTGDSTVNIRYSRMADDAYANSRLVEYIGAGHGFHRRDRSDALQKVLAFVKEHDKRY